jgi:hypothetical protein
MKLLRKSIIPHFIVMIQIVGMSIAFVVVINVTRISELSISTFRDGGYRSILCMNPILDTQSTGLNFKNDVLQKASQSPRYIGASSIGWSFCMDGSQALGIVGEEGENAEIITVNDVALKGFNIPVASGRPLTDSETLLGGEIPCVIGGKDTNKYRVGSTFTGYVLVSGGAFSSTEEMQAAPKAKITLRVVGKLNKPEQILNVTSNMSWSGEIPASRLLENYYDRPLVAIVPERLYPYIRSESQLVYVFFAKDTPDDEMQALKETLGGAFAKLDSELIGEEEIEYKNNKDILSPFTGLLLATSITSVFSLCLLTTVRNSGVLSVYNLVGCSRLRIFRIVTTTALFHSLLSLIVFLIAVNVISTGGAADIVGYYFILTPQSSLIVGILSLAVVLTAFLSGILVTQRRTVSFMLRKDKK